MQQPPKRPRTAFARIDDLPPSVREAFQRAAALVEPHLSPAAHRAWAAEGVALAQGGPRHADAAVEYFRASPDMAQALTARRLLRWARHGRAVAGESGVAAAAFYKASPAVLVHLPPAQIGAWADMGLRLCATADFADTLARRFFDLSPRLLQHAPASTLALLTAMLAEISPRSLDLSVEMLNQALRLFAEVQGDDLAAFLGDAGRLARLNLMAVRPYFDGGLTIYSRLSPGERDVYLSMVERVSVTVPRSLPTFLAETARHMGPVVAAHGSAPLAMSARIAGLSSAAAREFIRNAGIVGAKLSTEQLTEWCRRGEALLAGHEASGIGYFRLQSREALDALTALSPAVELEDVRELLRLYCQALMGRTVSIVASEKVKVDGNSVHWSNPNDIDWEGAAIFCPSRMQEFDHKDGNFEAYKVLATHQAGHLEFGTFDFTMAGDGRLLQPLRQTLARIQGKDRAYLTEFEVFFDLFADRRLARDLFTIAEDTRIDRQVRGEYRGIRRAYRRVQENAVTLRPDHRTLPLREQVVEMLVRMSLEASPVYDVPEVFAGTVWTAAGLINLLAGGPAAAEDAAEAAVRLYVLLRRIPNYEPESYRDGPWVTLDLAQAHYDPAAEDRDQIIRDFLEVNREQPPAGGASAANEERAEDEYDQMRPVGHRGDLKPELHQVIRRLQEQNRQMGQRQQQDDDDLEGVSSNGLTLEEQIMLLEQYALTAGEMEGWDDYDGMLDTSGRVINDLLRNLRNQRDQAEKAQYSEETPHAGEDEVQTAVYDEWDYRAKAYRPNWCQVRQRVLKEGSGEFYDATLGEYRGLVNAVRKQFEMLRPENIGKIKRLQDGEEFDLDGVIDAHVERRIGHTPDDKIYWRRNKVERNVAVALLVDLSLSTDERIEREAPNNGREPESDRTRRLSTKRIIDLERESIVLFIEALEQIGDTYGIYGFSGSGRDDVQYYTIKDMDEYLSERVRRRVDRVVPLQGTRMGPAIRHTIAKLARAEARTKILIMLSDGRPQDRDYGTLPYDPEQWPRSVLRYGGDWGPASANRDALMLDEKEYAVHDTKQALNEARTRAITPFCISVDKAGHDYLRAMCGDIGYEVVSDIESLPRRLPALYKRLTT